MIKHVDTVQNSLVTLGSTGTVVGPVPMDFVIVLCYPGIKIRVFKFSVFIDESGYLKRFVAGFWCSRQVGVILTPPYDVSN